MQIINVMAASLDGKIAAHSFESDAARRSYGFTNETDKEFVRQQLTTADAVITGANSLRASGATWQVKNHNGKFATWIVLTTKGIDSSARFWSQTEVERWIVSPQPVELFSTQNVRNLVYGNQHPAKFVAEMAANAGFQRALLFGGGEINRLFYDANLVDELKLTICPIIIGATGASDFVAPGLSHPRHLTLQSSQPIKDLVFLTYKVQKT